MDYRITHRVWGDGASEDEEEQNVGEQAGTKRYVGRAVASAAVDDAQRRLPSKYSMPPGVEEKFVLKLAFFGACGVRVVRYAPFMFSTTAPAEMNERNISRNNNEQAVQQLLSLYQ
jgi:hypothetical protein